MGSLYNVRAADHNKTLGIELECLYPDRFGLPRYGSFFQFWYFDSDGSINAPYRQYGYECISQPLPLEALIKQIKRLHKKFGVWEFNDSCGIHVHVSRQMMTQRHRLALTAWMCKLTEPQQQQLFGRRYNTYASPTTWGDDKYHAINNLHEATYEFRVFSSGDVNWAIECVKRTYIMATYKGELTYENMCKAFGIEPLMVPPLIEAFREAAAIPAVRRVRRIA